MSIPRWHRLYFAQCPETGLVKIGITGGLRHRLSLLRRKGQAPVELLASVPVEGYRIEGRVHARLAEHHESHEWFRPHEEVLAMASAIRWGLLDPHDLPDLTSPLRQASAFKAHATRRARLAEAA